MAKIGAHNEKAAGVWGGAGRNYDKISEGIADSIEHAIARLWPSPGERVFDLACGTGWTSRRLAEKGCAVTGVDLGEGVVAAAKEIARERNLEIDFQVGDAEELSFGDGQFDALASTCGVMFASRPEIAAREMARIVKPEGRIALTTWVKGSNVEKMFEVMKAHMPAPPPSPTPFDNWGSEENIRRWLEPHFTVEIERAISHFRVPSGEAAWDIFSTGYGPTKSLANALDPEKRAALRRDFVSFHERFRTGPAGVTVPRDYFCVIGIRK
jgi:SAM-dependent methyltransferase